MCAPLVRNVLAGRYIRTRVCTRFQGVLSAPYQNVAVRVPAPLAEQCRDVAAQFGWELADLLRMLLCVGASFYFLIEKELERSEAASVLLGGLRFVGSWFWSYDSQDFAKDASASAARLNMRTKTIQRRCALGSQSHRHRAFCLSLRSCTFSLGNNTNQGGAERRAALRGGIWSLEWT